MRKDKLYLATLIMVAWILLTYRFLYRPRPRSGVIISSKRNFDAVHAKNRLGSLEKMLTDLSKERNVLLEETKKILKDGISQGNEGQGEKNGTILERRPFKKAENSSDRVIIPVLMIACNRVTVNKSLDSLLEQRPDKRKFPIIVSQDCGDERTKAVIEGYGDEISLIEHPEWIPNFTMNSQQKKFKGYYKISQHYGWALRQVFDVMHHDQVKNNKTCF